MWVKISTVTGSGSSRKPMAKWKGPLKVSKSLGNDWYEVTDIPGSTRSRVPYSGAYATEYMKRWITFDGQEELVVEGSHGLTVAHYSDIRGLRKHLDELIHIIILSETRVIESLSLANEGSSATKRKAQFVPETKAESDPVNLLSIICNTDNTDPICHVQATIQTIFDVVDPGFGLESVEPYYGMEGGEGMLLKKFQMDFKSR
nr:unnamed protein product [Callosobruchus analis]